MHVRQPRPGQVGPAAAGDDRGHVGVGVGGREQRRGRTGAGAEVAQGGVGVTPGSLRSHGGRHPQPLRQQRDVEDVGPVALLLGR